MTHFSCNVNRIALLRNSRSIGVPNLLDCARIVLEAGAFGLTVHPRPDERHIMAADVAPLSALVAEFTGREFNIEGNPHHNLMPLLEANRPQQATFVPDSWGQATSNHGFAAGGPMDEIAPLIAQAQAWGARVCVFVDPDLRAIEAAKEAGADGIELYTETFAVAHATGDFADVLERFARAAQFARMLGLRVNAGHDLNLNNLPAFLQAVGPDEVSIGHAVISDALLMGLETAVEAYVWTCAESTFPA